MYFGKWRDSVVTLQCDTFFVGDLHLSNRQVPSDKTDMLNGAFWVKVFRAYHVKAIPPETLAGFLSDQVMPIAKSVYDFDLSHLQSRQAIGIGLAVR